MTLKEAYDDFMLYQHLRGNSASTITNYRDMLSRFIEYVGSKDVKKLTIGDVNSYQLYLLSSEIGQISVRTYMIHIRAFMNYLHNEYYVCGEIVKKLRVPKAPKKLHNILMESEIRELLSVFDTSDFVGSRDIAIVMLMLDCGFRKGEIDNLKTVGINFEKGFIFLLGKGNRERVVPLGEKVGAALRRYMELREYHSSPYFFLKADGTPLGKETIKNIFRRLRDKTGIDRLHPHLLRHTFATNFLINGLGDIYELSRILGHSELKTTQIYVNIANNYILMEKKQKVTYLDTVMKP